MPKGLEQGRRMVYVDPLMDCVPNPNWRWDRACHLFADDVRELHAFAKKIGLRRAWFQYKPGKLPHYDLNDKRRAAAIKAGAIHDAGHHIMGRHIKIWKPSKEGLRPDGWPLCPKCGEDEPACLPVDPLAGPPIGTGPEIMPGLLVDEPLIPVMYYLEIGLDCIACGWESSLPETKGKDHAKKSGGRQ